MKVLVIHAEEFSSRITEKAVKEAEEAVVPQVRVKNALVVFISVEEGDLPGVDQISVKFVDDIKDLAGRLRPSSIVLYPYAHLSRNLARPEEALGVLSVLEVRTREALKEVPIFRLPFGWYKQFTINCYGHPLSELSREYRPEVPPAVRGVVSECYIMSKEGDLIAVSPGREYPRELESVLRSCMCLSEGTLDEWRVNEGVKELFKKFSFRLVKNGSGIRLYRLGRGVCVDEALMNLSESILRRAEGVFNLHGLKAVTCGYATEASREGDSICFISEKGLKHCVSSDVALNHVEMAGGLSMADENRSYYLYEAAVVIKATRASDFRSSLSSMKKPQLTVFLKKAEESIQLMLELTKHILNVLEALELREYLVPVIRVSSRKYDEGLWEPMGRVLSKAFKEVVIVVREGEGPWELSVEFYYIDSRNVATLVTRTSMSMEIKDSVIRSRHAAVLSSELAGPSEVLMYALIDRALRLETSGKTPYLPVFTMPTQVKIIPLNRELITYANHVAERLTQIGIRVDIDGREVSLGKRIRDAGVEWIPYIVVVGERERETNTVNVRERRTGVQRSMIIEEFVDFLKRQLKQLMDQPLISPQDM
ncbi:MAG: threonyl-tRNA synthetase editing domain-containing protein [Zestosphaera sp.]